MFNVVQFRGSSNYAYHTIQSLLRVQFLFDLILLHQAEQLTLNDFLTALTYRKLSGTVLRWGREAIPQTTPNSESAPPPIYQLA